MADDVTPSLPKPANAISALMKRKVFGVPVMVFALLAAGVALYFAFKLKAGPELPDTPLPDDGFGGDEGDGARTPIFTARPVPLSNLPDEEGDGDGEGMTVQEWVTQAITWLISQGENTQLATSAITKYVHRNPVSMQERVLIDRVLAHFGPPPTGYQNVPNQPNGPPGRQGNPPTKHIVRGQQDNQPAELTLLYYGRTDSEAVRYLLGVNWKLTPPYKRGARIDIPLYREPKYFKATARIDTPAEIARKNGTSPQAIRVLNPGMDFPVPPDTRVRVQ